jgi:hypothetical protein
LTIKIGNEHWFTSPLNPLSKYGEGTYKPRFSPSPRGVWGLGGEVNYLT